MAAAVAACQCGHKVTVFEASRTLGGRARAIAATLPDGSPATLDNGQHILIGAYTETLRVMRMVGVDVERALMRRPLALPFADGSGLQTPRYATNWTAPLDAIAAIATARGWTWAERWSLITHSLGWQWRHFHCAPELSVAQLCAGLAPRVLHELIEPLCVSALNTPAHLASAQVFLRVLRDALFGIQGGSHLLLPRTDLSTLFPEIAANWLTHRGCQIHIGRRVGKLRWQAPHWLLDDQPYERVILAMSASNAATALVDYARSATDSVADSIFQWTRIADAMGFEAIATVYAWAARARLPYPMMALRNTPVAPAQFVFDRGQFNGTQGLLAFVVSAAQGSRESLQSAVMNQAREQLAALELPPLQAVQTVVEKHATFACTPKLARPPAFIATGLYAAGDYLDGPYPATLEGAVRSGWNVGTLP
jgi:squalene-associated FAD-dependent desaturase